MAIQRETSVGHEAHVGRGGIPASTTRTAKLVLVISFLFIIALPLASNLAGRDGADPDAEKRELAAFPRLNLSWQSIARFGNDFARWFDDHFGFRAALVRWYGETRLFWLDVSPSAAVVKGNDGWLFYGEDSGLEDYTAETLFAPADLERWRIAVADTNAWLAARGIAFLFVVAPDKHVIYPDEMPASLRRMNDTSRTDQLYGYLDSKTGVQLVDVRPALMEARRRERVYYLTDTHWNDRGALIAYQQIIGAARHAVPAVPPAWRRDDFAPVQRYIEGQDLAGMIGLKRVIGETDLALLPRRPRKARVIEPAGADASAEEGFIVTEIPGSSLPRAVIVRDSFASRLAPFLSEHFSRAVYEWQNYVDLETVQRERPAVVIQEIVGRHLFSVAPYDDVPNAIPRDAIK